MEGGKDSTQSTWAFWRRRLGEKPARLKRWGDMLDSLRGSGFIRRRHLLMREFVNLYATDARYAEIHHVGNPVQDHRYGYTLATAYHPGNFPIDLPIWRVTREERPDGHKPTRNALLSRTEVYLNPPNTPITVTLSKHDLISDSERLYSSMK